MGAPQVGDAEPVRGPRGPIPPGPPASALHPSGGGLRRQRWGRCAIPGFYFRRWARMLDRAGRRRKFDALGPRPGGPDRSNSGKNETGPSQREERFVLSGLNDPAHPAAVRTVSPGPPVVEVTFGFSESPVPMFYFGFLESAAAVCANLVQDCVKFPVRAASFGIVAFPFRAARTSLPSGCAFTPAGHPCATRLSLSLSSHLASLQYRAEMLHNRHPCRSGGPPPTPTKTHWGEALPLPLRGAGSRFAASASRFPSSPRFSGRAFGPCCIPLSIFRFCSLFFSALPAGLPNRPSSEVPPLLTPAAGSSQRLAG